MTGFDHIVFVGPNVDRALVNALQERWRPETYTFILPWGECTVTLNDIALLTRLHTDGHLVVRRIRGWTVGTEATTTWFDSAGCEGLYERSDYDYSCLASMTFECCPSLS